MILPNFKKEKTLFRRGYKTIVGVDEAGRGPLAGPVTAAALSVEKGSLLGKQLKGLRDSKKLNRKQREKIYEFLTRHPQVRWAVASVGPGTIDRINVARAADLAVAMAAGKIGLKSKRKVFFLLDGGLSLPSAFRQEAVVKGDEKIWSVAAASIIAKVTRDRIMRRLARKFPAYGFDSHKGYGTRLHYRMLKAHGPSAIHRRTFCGVIGGRGPRGVAKGRDLW